MILNKIMKLKFEIEIDTESEQDIELIEKVVELVERLKDYIREDEE